MKCFTFIISETYKWLKIRCKTFLVSFWIPGNIHFRCKSRETETEKGRTEARPVMKCMFDCVCGQSVNHPRLDDVVEIIRVGYNTKYITVITE